MKHFHSLRIFTLVNTVTLLSSCTATPLERAKAEYLAGNKYAACKIASDNASWDSDSMVILGGCHADGIGGHEQDIEKAVAWYTLAARYDNSRGRSALVNLNRPVPFPDLAIAQQTSQNIEMQNSLLKKQKNEEWRKAGEAVGRYFGSR